MNEEPVEILSAIQHPNPDWDELIDKFERSRDDMYDPVTAQEADEIRRRHNHARIALRSAIAELEQERDNLKTALHGNQDADYDNWDELIDDYAETLLGVSIVHDTVETARTALRAAIAELEERAKKAELQRDDAKNHLNKLSNDLYSVRTELRGAYLKLDEANEDADRLYSAPQGTHEGNMARFAHERRLKKK